MNDRPYITCRQLIDYILAYVEGDLNPIERSDFEQHLARCPSCQAYLRTYDETMRLTHELVRNESLAKDVPDELVKAILRRTR